MARPPVPGAQAAGAGGGAGAGQGSRPELAPGVCGLKAPYIGTPAWTITYVTSVAQHPSPPGLCETQRACFLTSCTCVSPVFTDTTIVPRHIRLAPHLANLH